MNKAFFRKVHLYVSLFFAPVAIMVAITGIAYIAGIDQDYGADVKKITVSESVPVEERTDFIKKYLAQNNLKVPADQAVKLKDKSAKGIGSAGYFATIASGKESGMVIEVTKRSFLGNMIMLHKNKGEWYFSVLMIGFGVTLFLLYISGVIIGTIWKGKSKKEYFATITAGVFVFALLAYLSL